MAAEPRELAILDQCNRQLKDIQDLRGILKIRDTAAAIASLLKMREGGQESAIQAKAIVAKCEKRSGELIREGQSRGEIETGGRPTKHSGDVRVSLADLGVTYNESSRFQTLADLTEEEIDAKAEECIQAGTDLTQQALIRTAKEKSNDGKKSKKPPAPKGLYDVIVIDPPWPMEKIEREVRPNQSSEIDYPVMTEDELAALILPAAGNCHLWIWTTHKFMPMALRLAPQWGFRYVCCFVWHKPGGFQPIGLPQYNCEFALYCRAGVPEFCDLKNFKLCFSAPRGAHSEKPEEFYDLIRRVTSGRRIDMFNRREIEGFDRWGNEV